jgi:plasmid stabilization system protein ParE
MTVYFSTEAEAQLEAIVAYLGENGSQRVKTDFLAQLAVKLDLITQMPELYRRSEQRPGLRECIVNRHTILYYKVEPAAIEVAAILSTHRGPDS